MLICVCVCLDPPHQKFKVTRIFWRYSKRSSASVTLLNYISKPLVTGRKQNGTLGFVSSRYFHLRLVRTSNLEAPQLVLNLVSSCITNNSSFISFYLYFVIYLHIRILLTYLHTSCKLKK